MELLSRVSSRASVPSTTDVYLLHSLCLVNASELLYFAKLSFLGPLLRLLGLLLGLALGLKYLGHLPLSVNLISAPTYHLTTANDHSQPGLHNFGWRTKTTISLLEQIYYRKHKKYFDRPRSDFILEIDHYMFRVFGHKYDKESPCKWVLVNSQFLCFGHFTTPC